MSPATARAEIVVDLAAIRHNVRLLRELVGAGADDDGGQGRRLRPRHAAVGPGRPAGRRRVARASPRIDEALALRAPATPAGCCAGSACPGERYYDAIVADVDVTAYSVAELAEIGAAAEQAGRPARLQLKVDTGLSRGGAAAGRLAGPGRGRARSCEERGHARGHRHLVALRLQRRARPPRQRRAGGGLPRGARRSAEDAGLRPEVRHLANSAAAILRPELALRPGALRHRVVRPRPGARAPPPTSGWCRR